MIFRYRVHVISGAERELKAICKLIRQMRREQQARFWWEFMYG